MKIFGILRRYGAPVLFSLLSASYIAQAQIVNPSQPATGVPVAGTGIAVAGQTVSVNYGVANSPFTGNMSVGGTFGVTGASTLGALSASGAVTGAGFTNLFAIPYPIGSTTPNSGAFTTLSNSGIFTSTGAAVLNGAVSGTGIAAYEATINHTQTIANVVALRALTCAAGLAFQTQNYASNGGGAVYRCVSSDTSSADNGATIIATTGGIRAYLVYQGRLSINLCGADQTGVADSTTAIATCMGLGVPLAATGTYKISSVQISGSTYNNLDIDATGAVFNTTKANAFWFQSLTGLHWHGGTINAGTDTTGLSASNWYPFTVTNSGNILTDGITVNCTNVSGSYAFAPITYWNVNRGIISNSFVTNGGDNSIWTFFGNDITIQGNTVYSQQHGRAITVQQTHGFAITGNIIKDGFGDGISVHGSDNGTVTGNVVDNMQIDTTVLTTARGISVETDENATTTTVANAVANLNLYNSVFARAVTISGNTVSNSNISMSFGGKLIVNNGFYGNQGIVKVVGNSFINNTQGVLLSAGTNNVEISGNNFVGMGQGGVLIELSADFGGYTENNINVRSNNFSNTNAQSLGYTSIHVTGGSALPLTSNFAISGNTFENIAGVATWTNLALGTIGLQSDGNNVINSTATIGYDVPVSIQAPFAATAGSSLASYFVVGDEHEFTISGSVSDTFTTVFNIPVNASIIADVQIGNTDRLVCLATIYAANSTTSTGTMPAQTIAGTCPGFTQNSSGAFQIKGNTSGGTAPYGGAYTIHFKVLKTG